MTFFISANNFELLCHEINFDDHMLTLEQLCQRYNTDVTNGMTSEAVEASRKRFGWNRLRTEKKRQNLLKFLNCLFGGFALLLWIGSAFCFLAYGVHDSPFENQPKDNLYLGVALIGVKIGYIEESL